ncbi:MAG: Rrf2 family transcriptional regulator [Phycisphaerae bacterium]|nr:Rrf2 family transcriptional regulator [Phycisphaerae bacterium]NUQ44999.1 Rrf2 family transcriptional regulator [Phycisphaerae bacterium]
MIYSIGCEYAIRAMTYLAENTKPGEYCLLRTITNEHDLPQHFVGKIFQSLVRAGLLYSAKGRGGGFALRRSAEEIRLYDIVQAIDGTERLTRCIIGLARCDDTQPCPQHDWWQPQRQQIERMLMETSLADLARNAVAKRGGAPARAKEGS